MAEETRGAPLWMKALASMFLLALAANAAMVYMSQHGRRDLVRSDYYAAGLAEDARLARRRAADPFVVTLSLSGDAWSVVLRPKDTLSGGSSASVPSPDGAVCRVLLRRPEDARLDRDVRLQPAGVARWTARAGSLPRGRYDAVVTWERDGAPVMESAFPWYAP